MQVGIGLECLTGWRTVGSGSARSTWLKRYFMMSAKGLGLHVRSSGIDMAGADDYLIKPFAFAELIMRGKALVNNTSVHAHP